MSRFGNPLNVASQLITRPADTTAYASGDLVANSTTAASVTPFVFGPVVRTVNGSGIIRRARIRKSGTSVTNAAFRLHLYNQDPSLATGITNGDNGAFLTKHAGYRGAMDITAMLAFSDGAVGFGAPLVGSEINFAMNGSVNLWGLLEARGAYTPASAEQFICELEIVRAATIGQTL